MQHGEYQPKQHQARVLEVHSNGQGDIDNDHQEVSAPNAGPSWQIQRLMFVNSTKCFSIILYLLSCKTAGRYPVLWKHQHQQRSTSQFSYWCSRSNMLGPCNNTSWQTNTNWMKSLMWNFWRLLWQHWFWEINGKWMKQRAILIERIFYELLWADPIMKFHKETLPWIIFGNFILLKFWFVPRLLEARSKWFWPEF